MSDPSQNGDIYEDQVGYLMARRGMTREEAEAEVDKFESRIPPPEQENTQEQ